MWPPSVIPPSGYWFDERGIRVESNNIAGLIAALVKFRQDSGATPGDPLYEVHAQLCARHPSLCTSGRKLAAMVPKSIRRFLSYRYGHVGKDEVERRAAICLKCPQRVDWRATCTSCNNSLNKALRKNFPGRVPELEGQACSIGGDEVSIAMLFDSGEKLPVAPQACWRKK